MVADIADKPRSRRNGNGQHRGVPCSPDSTCSSTAEGRVTLGRHEGQYWLCCFSNIRRSSSV